MNSFQQAACKVAALCATFGIAAAPVAAQVPLNAHPTVAAGQAHTGTHHKGKPRHHAPVKKADATKPVMTLKFFNVHTSENLTLTRQNGEALPQNAEWFMRDYRRGTMIPMDPRLFDLLGKLQTALQKQHPRLNVTFQVVSSYRTPATNEGLREAGGTQAEHSQHMLGKAMDIRVPGISTEELRNTATCLKLGGVGYYAEDKFVHVDVGRVRYWPSHNYLASLPCPVRSTTPLQIARAKSPAPA